MDYGSPRGSDFQLQKKPSWRCKSFEKTWLHKTRGPGLTRAAGGHLLPPPSRATIRVYLTVC
jgi:hypothetical protein